MFCSDCCFNNKQVRKTNTNPLHYRRPRESDDDEGSVEQDQPQLGNPLTEEQIIAFKQVLSTALGANHLEKLPPGRENGRE